MSVQLSQRLADRVPARPLSPAAIFGVLGGPLAWYVELLLGYALASGPCFPHDQRLVSPQRDMAWTHTGVVCLLMLCTLVAFAAFFVSWRRMRRISTGDFALERTRFVAMWGVALGAGFLVATLLTAVGIGVLPRCAG
jgi:hypothetical protein